jgi:AcrR family transcriptional regulator
MSRAAAPRPAVTRRKGSVATAAPVTRRSQGRRTQQAIYDAAVRSFAAKGYAGTSLRSLAAEVGVEVGSLYRHFASKEELLFSVIRGASDDFYASLTATLAKADEHPVARLRALTEETARYHALHGAQSLVGSFEVRELTRAHFKHVIGQRHLVEGLYKKLVEECIDEGYFPADTNPSVMANFVISTATSIATWYDPSGALGPDQIAAMAADFAVPNGTNHSARFPSRGSTRSATRSFKR